MENVLKLVQTSKGAWQSQRPLGWQLGKKYLLPYLQHYRAKTVFNIHALKLKITTQKPKQEIAFGLRCQGADTN